MKSKAEEAKEKALLKDYFWTSFKRKYKDRDIEEKEDFNFNIIIDGCYKDKIIKSIKENGFKFLSIENFNSVGVNKTIFFSCEESPENTAGYNYRKIIEENINKKVEDYTKGIISQIDECIEREINDGVFHYTKYLHYEIINHKKFLKDVMDHYKNNGFEVEINNKFDYYILNKMPQIKISWDK